MGVFRSAHCHHSREIWNIPSNTSPTACCSVRAQHMCICIVTADQAKVRDGAPARPPRCVSSSTRPRYNNGSPCCRLCCCFTGARGLRAMVDPVMVHGVDPVWLHQVFTGAFYLWMLQYLNSNQDTWLFGPNDTTITHRLYLCHQALTTWGRLLYLLLG